MDRKTIKFTSKCRSVAKLWATEKGRVSNPPGGCSSVGRGKFLELFPPTDDVIYFGGHEIVHFAFLVEEEEVTVALALSVTMELLAG